MWPNETPFSAVVLASVPIATAFLPLSDALAFKPIVIEASVIVLAFGPIAIALTPDAPVLFWLPVTFDLTEK